MKTLSPKPDINLVVKSRLKLQSTQSSMIRNFGISPSKALTIETYLKYLSWDDTKKDSFIELLGGYVNRKQTKSFFEKMNIK